MVKYNMGTMWNERKYFNTKISDMKFWRTIILRITVIIYDFN